MLASEKFTTVLSQLRLKIEQGPTRVPLRQVISLFGPRGHWLLALFLVLPFLQPIPIPGLSCVLGSCIALVGVFSFLGTPPRVPNRIARIEVEKNFLLKVTSALESLLKKLDHVVKPRGREWIERPIVRKFHASLLMYHAVLLALPLPVPFSNLVPAICLMLIALGCLVEDVAVLGVSYLAVLANLVFFGAVVVVPFLL